MRPLKAPNRPDTTISVSTWVTRSGDSGEKVIVAYWYEVGDHTMFERMDLLKTQWAMCGKTKWPVMFKVLLEMPAGETDLDPSRQRRSPGHGPICAGMAGDVQRRRGTRPDWNEKLSANPIMFLLPEGTSDRFPDRFQDEISKSN